MCRSRAGSLGARGARAGARDRVRGVRLAASGGRARAARLGPAHVEHSDRARLPLRRPARPRAFAIRTRYRHDDSDILLLNLGTF